MKKRILDLIIKWLQQLQSKLMSQEVEQLPYNSLSPIANADIDRDYKIALDWALKNRKKEDIKNIALTGPYGSGKSSILKTFVETYSGKDLHFLNISLATFKEEEQNPNQQLKPELLRLIELSILQQIFYHEKDAKIPDSRFRKIKNHTKANLVATTILVVLLLTSIIHLAQPAFLERLFQIQFSKPIAKIIHNIGLLLSLTISFLLIYRSVRIINSIKISKLNFQNAEIEISEHVNKSILNHHIDEILYFFEVTKYNVVIIEDLDRFKQTEIFTKLREINSLINNSKKIKKDVVFIYAVRDDMFIDNNERTKFFDFIIPVIPIINPSNSAEKLIEKQVQHKYSISENLIDSISLFIDDMRLMHNITNEFYLYRQKLNATLNQDKLLAMIVYKNTFPSDFTLLGSNEGIIFNAINDKQKYIHQEIQNIDSKIEELKNEISYINDQKLKSITELRYLYLLFYSTNLPGFISFNIEGVNQTPEQMANDKNFDLLLNGGASYQYYQNYSSYTAQISTKFSAIEKRVDSGRKYAERKKLIEDPDNNKTEFLKKQIQDLEKAKSNARNLKIRELLGRGNPLIKMDNIKQQNLINVLLRNGFIDEDYLDYMTLFHEGSITKNDHQYLINVKSQIPTEFNYTLTKIEKLIAKINKAEFDKEYVLNYQLLDFVLTKDNHKEICELILTKLSDESAISIKFINGFIDSCKNIEAFIKNFVKKWSNIWSFLETKSNYSSSQINTFFVLIIEFAELEDIKKLYETYEFKEELLRRKPFLNIIPDSDRLKRIISLSKIKFRELDFTIAPTDLIEHIYQGNYYEINNSFIKSMLKFKDQYNENDFETRNYSAISNSKCKEILTYLHAEINSYIENVYFKLENNWDEPEEYITNLLNNTHLSRENKIKLIKFTRTKISDLSAINDADFFDYLFEESKVVADWNSIIYYYEFNENKISDSVVIYLDQIDNSSVLSSQMIEVDSDKSETISDFCISLILMNDLKEAAYDLILKSIPHSFSVDINSLSKNKVYLLLQNYILTFDPTNYKRLKKIFPELLIRFIELNKAEFLKLFNNFNLDSNDVLKLLESEAITKPEKNKFTEELNEDLIIGNNASLKILGELILSDNSFRVSDQVLKLIIVNETLTLEQRIRIHNWKHRQILNEYYYNFMNSLGEPYSDVTINGKRPLLRKTEYNEKLAEILDAKGYISKFDIEEKGIRISTFRKTN